jgi:DNA-binding MarR family transcriptional regulator
VADVHDRRTAHLRVTEEGSRLVEAVIAEIAERSNFVRAFRRLRPEDREALGRSLGALHGELDRILPGA